MLADPMSGEILPPNLQMASFSFYPTLAENRQSIGVSLLYKDFNHMTYELFKGLAF